MCMDTDDLNAGDVRDNIHTHLGRLLKEMDLTQALTIQGTIILLSALASSIHLTLTSSYTQLTQHYMQFLTGKQKCLTAASFALSSINESLFESRCRAP